MKPTKTPQEKFKAGLKKSGYDPDAGAKRLLDLIAKQKKEREEFESKYKSAYEGREMKTLKQIVEGSVVMTDFKLDKRGRRYKAHRTTMGRDVRVTNEGRAEDAFAELDKEIENKRNPKPNASSIPVTRREKPDQFDKTLMEPTDKDPKDATYIWNGRKVDRETFDKNREAHLNKPVDPRETDMEDDMGKFKERAKERARKKTNEARDPREYDYEGDMAKSQLRSIMANAKQAHDMLKDDTNMAEWVQSKITLAADYISTVADYMQSEIKEDIEQVDEVSKETVSGYNKKAMAYIKNYKYSNNPPSVRRKLENRFSGVIRADERLKGTKPTSEEVEQVDEGATKIDQQSGSDRAFDVTHKDTNKKIGTVYTPGKTNPNHVATVNGLDGRPGKTGEFSSFKEAHKFITDNHPLTRNVEEGVKLDEARGRPAGAATLAKRAAAAAKPRDDDDEGEHYDADSGVEADQHIHVQLKKAADSDQKPFEVSFKNGKKHKVSQKVAKDILGATERLKPEHRKNVHDEIHQSYDNLMSVHRLVAGR